MEREEPPFGGGSFLSKPLLSPRTFRSRVSCTVRVRDCGAGLERDGTAPQTAETRLRKVLVIWRGAGVLHRAAIAPFLGCEGGALGEKVGWLLRGSYRFCPSWIVSDWLASDHRRSRLLAPLRGSTARRFVAVALSPSPVPAAPLRMTRWVIRNVSDTIYFRLR